MPDEVVTVEETGALVRRAKEGDEAAFAALYNLRVSEVYRYVRSLLNDHATAEDVTAQTFLQAWQHLPQLKDVERFDGWLFRIAHNQAISETRRRPTSALDTIAEPVDPSPLAAPEALLERKLSAAAVRRALRQLPDSQREVLVLRFYGELSHAQVAAQIGTSEPNARVLQFRALKQLRSLIEAQGASVR